MINKREERFFHFLSINPPSIFHLQSFLTLSSFPLSCYIKIKALKLSTNLNAFRVQYQSFCNVKSMLLRNKCYNAEKQRQSARTKRKFFYLINHNATLAHKLLLTLFFEWKEKKKTRCNKQISIALRSFMKGVKNG